MDENLIPQSVIDKIAEAENATRNTKRTAIKKFLDAIPGISEDELNVLFSINPEPIKWKNEKV